MVDYNCGGDNGNRPPEKRYGLALKSKSVDECLVQAKTNLNAFSFLAALSGFVGMGLILFVIGLIAYALWVM